MTDSNQFPLLKEVLKNYQLEPHFVEDLGKIQKVYTNNGIFALKKIDPQSGTDFIRHVHTLYQKGYNRIVPVYPTMDGRYAVLHEKDLYYLMPWLPNEPKEETSARQIQLFRELARLHSISAKEIEINKEERKEHYEKTIEEMGKKQDFLDGFVEECEYKEYMSPFELLFCLYYNEISQALRFSKGKFEEWYQSTKDQEKARMVIIHGKLSCEHFLYDERGYGYFTNFEEVGYGSPIHDLLPFLSRSLRTTMKKNDECIDWVQHYYKYFPFKPDEKLLFYSYLSYPILIIQAVEKYYQKWSKRNELKSVIQLQRQYWQLKNTEYVVMRIFELDQPPPDIKEGAPE